MNRIIILVTMETKKRVILALLILSIVLSIFSIIISLNASSNNTDVKQPTYTREIIKIYEPGNGKVNLNVESAPEGENTNGE
jgi:hypothetical protein